ncbi:MAG: type II secretion system F family protein [Gaiellaceae bacterium]
MRNAAVLAAFAGACALVSAAHAATAVRVTGVDVSGYPELRLTVVGPAGSAQPTVEENGRPVSGEQAVSLASGKDIVLAVDRSRSMVGTSLARAVAAARALVDTASAGDELEVIGFGSHAETLSGFSSPTTGITGDTLGKLAVDRASGTALWDAVLLAAGALQHTTAGHGRVIVVVTDGSDVSSSATLAEAVAAAHHAHASIYAVGIDSPDFKPAPLRQLASETGGNYLQATSSAQLARVYRSIATSLGHTWQIRYATGARPGERVRLAVTFPGTGTGEREIDVPGVAATVAPSRPILSRSVWTSKLAPVALAAAVGALVLLAVLFGLTAVGRNWLSARLEPHLGPARRRRKARHGRDVRHALKRLFAATERTFANVKQFRALQRLLARADLPLLAAELVYSCLGSAIACGLVAILAGASVIFVLLIVVAGGCIPVLVVAYKARARIRAFDDQLPDLLTTIAASLKAGHSFRHAIQSVVDEGTDPAAGEFRRVITETRLGRPMDEALAELSARIGSKNLAFALTAVTIQRQIGGSLAGLFDMVADTVRQRQHFARKIRALTAMGRMSAYVLVALPFVVALAVTVLNHHYMAPLWGTAAGHDLVGAGLGMIAVGSLILRKIVTFRG